MNKKHTNKVYVISFKVLGELSYQDINNFLIEYYTKSTYAQFPKHTHLQLKTEGQLTVLTFSHGNYEKLDLALKAFYWALKFHLKLDTSGVDSPYVDERFLGRRLDNLSGGRNG